MQTLYYNGPEVRGEGRQRVQAKAQAQRPNVVVLGAGFAGLWAARTLADGPVKFC